MAAFKKIVNAKYEAKDYDGVLKNFDWISSTITNLFNKNIELEASIDFKMGDISCACDSIDEFKEQAYGQKIEVSSYALFLYQGVKDDRKSLACMVFDPFFGERFTVNCGDKQTLIEICTVLEDTLSTPENTQPILLRQTVNHIDQSTNISVENNNTINNSNIGVDNQVKKEESAGKDSFWKPIFQTIVANWIWFLLGLVVLGMLTYLGITNSDWMSIF